MTKPFKSRSACTERDPKGRVEVLPVVASGANFAYQFELQKVKRISKRKIARDKRRESYVNPIERAREYHRIMRKEGITQSQLAVKLGVSRVRVNQYLALLKLPKEHQSYILQHGKDQKITERQLRRFINH